MFDIIFMRTCKHCGKFFETNVPRQIYCNSKCKEAHANALKKKARDQKAGPGTACLLCGHIIGPDRTGQAKYCSEECSREAKLKRSREQSASKGKTYKKKCKHCGASFTTTRGYQLYCSEKCSNRANYEKFKKRHAKPKPAFKTKVCAYCGREFQTDKRSQKYCGADCANEMKKQQNRKHWLKYHGKPVNPKPPEEKAIRPVNHPEKKLGEYETINKTLKKLHAEGVRYSDYQRAKTLAMITPINLNIGG